MLLREVARVVAATRLAIIVVGQRSTSYQLTARLWPASSPDDMFHIIFA